MTTLQGLYLKARTSGLRHYAALRAVAADTGLDEGTVDRCLRRARQLDERDERRRRRERQAA